MRIVSLLPSATEIVCELGLADQLVGVSHECDFPSFVTSLPRVTQTLIPHEATSSEINRLVRERLQTRQALYSLDLQVFQQLAPDLIVTQALCDVCAVAEDEVNAAVCALPGQPRVINLEPHDLAEVLSCMTHVGEAAGAAQAAERAVARLQDRIANVVRRSQTIRQRPRVVLLEWIDPLFSCGHWSPELVGLAGGIEGIGLPGKPSQRVAWSEIVEFDPEVLVIACCGFNVERTLRDLPLLRQHPGFEQLTCVRDDRVYVIDGNAYFSRPGPRLVEGLEILSQTLHPDTPSLPNGLPPARRVSRREMGSP